MNDYPLITFGSLIKFLISIGLIVRNDFNDFMLHIISSLVNYVWVEFPNTCISYYLSQSTVCTCSMHKNFTRK